MKKHEKIMMGMLIILFLSTMNINNKITRFVNDTQHKQNNMQSEINRLSISMRDIQNNIATTMEEIKAENLWVSKKEYNVLVIDDHYENIELLLQWQFRELNKEEEIYLIYSEKDENIVNDPQWKKIQLTHAEGLNYEMKLNLPYRKNYEFQLMAETSRGIRSQSLFELSFKENFENRIGGYAEVLPFRGQNEKIDIHIGVFNSLYDPQLYPNVDKLKMKSAKANIYVQGQLKETIDLMEQGDDRWESSQDESINHFANLQLENVENISREDIEVEIIVEDYLGNIYKPKLKN